MSRNRLTELDGLRGIAALVVLLYHYFIRYDQIYGHEFAAPEFLDFGHYGVQLFFIISGFVIYWSINNTTKPIDFIWSRFCRLYPTYWVCLFITFTVVSYFGLAGREATFFEFFMNLTMLQGFLGYKNVDGVYWTLTLELAFYFWILIIFLTKQLRNIQLIMIAWVAFAAIATFHRVQLNTNDFFNKLLLLQHIELFAAGICFYQFKNKTQNKQTYILLTVCTIALFAGYSYDVAIGLTMLYLIFLFIVNYPVGLLASKPLVFLGSISYALYLLHQNVGYLILNTFYQSDLPIGFGILLAIIVSIILATVVTYYIERPIIKILKQYRQKNSNKVIQE